MTTSVARPSIADPVLYADVNVTGTAVLLEAARKARVRAFVLASSSSVYGARNDPPFRESDPPATAISPWSKASMEKLRVSWQTGQLRTGSLNRNWPRWTSR